MAIFLARVRRFLSWAFIYPIASARKWLRLPPATPSTRCSAGLHLGPFVPDTNMARWQDQQWYTCTAPECSSTITAQTVKLSQQAAPPSS